MYYTRREFIKELAIKGISLSSATLLWDIITPQESKATERLKEVEWYTPIEDKRVQCFICPKNCVLSKGQTCYCRTRTNINGRLYSSAWNNPCKLEITQIETGPFYHFIPGEKVLSIGVSGCNLRCRYCQNWRISQARPERTKNYKMDSTSVIKASARRHLKGILFTYTEPVAYLEYLIDTASKAKSKGLSTAVATSGYINKKPLMETAKYIDAFVVTLKGFNEEFYQKVCSGDLRTVLTALETIKEKNKWLEITNLIVPTINDNPEEIRRMAIWIKDNLGDKTPLHFTRFVPAYRMRHLKETPIGSLEIARTIAMDAGLRYVYVTNLPGHIGGDTYCHNCGRTVIQRAGFKVIAVKLKDGRCMFCNEEIPGEWVV
jgi:pyruvate formate lyase activating enzyme